MSSVNAALEEVADATGINYVHSTSEERTPDEAGACAVDLNRDGWTDLLFARFGDSILALINNGDGTFRQATSELGLTTYRDIAAIAAAIWTMMEMQISFLVRPMARAISS